MQCVKKLRVEEHADPAQLDEKSDGVKPWAEKHRPATLDDIEGQEDVVNALKKCLASETAGNLPHMLFYGPPGTGKTSTILAFAAQLFGPDYAKTRVKELNASDDRGIAVVRDKVKAFAQGAAHAAPHKVQSDGKQYPVPKFKIIVLDEADALLPDAQAALRRMMEDFSDVTRFCILCNYVSKIIDPIASRAVKFRFKPLVQERLWHKMRSVAAKEGLTVSDATLHHLDQACQGDLRLAMTYMQSAARAHGADLANEDFVVIASLIPANAMGQYTAALMSKRYDNVEAATRRLVAEGYCALQLVTQLQRMLVEGTGALSASRLSAVGRGVVAIKLAQVEKRLLDGGDDQLQLLDLGATFLDVVA